MHDNNAPPRKTNLQLDARKIAKPADERLLLATKLSYGIEIPVQIPTSLLPSGLPTWRTLRQHHCCGVHLGDKQYDAEEFAEAMSHATDHKTLAKACLVQDALPVCTHRQQAMQKLVQT